MKRVGIFSGTFDPVHAGHVAFAKQAKEQCGLDLVVFLPEKKPRQKLVGTTLRHRLAMLRLATADNPAFYVTTLSNDRFTVAASLPELKELFTGDKLYFLCGSDTARTFLYRWEAFDQFIRHCTIVVGLRQQDTLQEMQHIFSQLQNEYHCTIDFVILPSPKPEVASSSVRKGERSPGDLDPAVEVYALKHMLYNQNTTSSA